MNGYAATARIRGAAPRVALAGGAWADRDPELAPVLVDGASVVLTQPDDRLPLAGPTLPERWDAARERWSQLTFYLFSPESWR